MKYSQKMYILAFVLYFCAYTDGTEVQGDVLGGVGIRDYLVAVK